MRAAIVGAGAQGRVVLDILRAQGGFEGLEFVDENASLHGTEVNGAPVTGSLSDLLERSDRGTALIVALGDPDRRLALAEEIRRRSFPFVNAIHPSAVVMPSASVGQGVMIGAAAVVNSNARVGDHAIVNTAAVVEHDGVLEEGVAIGPGAHLGGRVRAGRCAFVSTGAIVLARVSIGARAIVGAGAVVTRDVPSGVLVLGMPARIREHLPEHPDWRRVL